MPGPAVSQLRRLLAAREKHAKLDKQTKAAKEKLDAAEIEVHEAFEADGVKGQLKIDVGEPWGVVAFQPGQTIYANVYDPEAYEKWVRKNRRGRELLGEPQVRKKPLNQLIRRMLQQRGRMPDGVEHRRTRYITVTRQRQK